MNFPPTCLASQICVAHSWGTQNKNVGAGSQMDLFHLCCRLIFSGSTHYDWYFIVLYFDVINTDKSAQETLTGVPYDKLTIGVPKEIHEGERRVALSPEAAKQLTKEGFKVVVEAGAGAGAKFLDSDYIAAGAEVKTVKDALGSDIVFKVSVKTNSVIDLCSL